MSSETLEKRTSESIIYDLDCSLNLGVAETISDVGVPTSDQGALLFGLAAINSMIARYPDGTTAGIGKVIQIRVSAGAVPVGSRLPDGRPGIRCTVRCTYTTLPSGNTREATALLDLTNTPAV